MNWPYHGNLFSDLPAPGTEEEFRPLFANGAVRIERIVSHHHASPPGFWYEQADDEWVLLIRGSATLAFDDGRTHALAPGDWLLLPAGCRHRVQQTAASTIWLAVHVKCVSTQPSVI